MVEMDVLGVKLELPSNIPVVMLREQSGSHRVLPIFIGPPEANAIAFALNGEEPPRPLTHDLFCNVVDALGATLLRVVITDLSEGTFYAELHLEGPQGPVTVSARPSDGIALALRAGVPVLATANVLDEAAVVLEEIDDDDPEASDEVVEQFREFIDNVNPEDFAS
ncbi:MAG: bifunctional nuclease family protein [Acidimicrobiia bacterium]|nr:bifunctional nuclease family protein [Acidimicrobiia bacterium]